MEENNASQRAEYLQKNKKRKRWEKIVSILACIVVFCTTYALILPAITMAKTTRLLTCPLSIHEHTDSCYDEDGNLTCGKADFAVHTHDESCYDKNGNLVCTLPEIKAHEHTPECYREVKTLTCTLEENEEHTHTEDCYTTEQVLACDNMAVLHRHTDECYDEDGNLICGQLEVLEHTHGSGCFAVEKNIEDGGENTVFTVRNKAKLMASAGSIDISENMISTVEVQRYNAESGLWEAVSDGKVEVGDEVRFNLKYEIPENTLSVNQKTLTYRVPSAINLTHVDSGEVLDGNNVSTGQYTIDEQGNITIVFNDEYAQRNANGAKINGHVWFAASVSNIQTGVDGKIHLPFSSTLDFTFDVYDTDGDLTVDKSSHNVAFSGGTLEYEIVISSAHGTASNNVILNDTMSCMQVDGPVVLTKNGQTLADSTYTLIVENGSIRGELPPMNAGDEYRISYPARATKDFTNKAVNGENDVTVTSTDSMGRPVIAHDSTSDTFTKKIMQKSGQVSDQAGMIDWTIVINAASPKMNIAGWTLTDSLAASSDITITPNPDTGSGSKTITLPYEFPAGKECAATYTITYQTDDSSTTNTATLTPPDSDNTAISAKGVVGKAVPDLKKTGIAMYAAGTDADGNKLVNCEWEITLDAATVAVQTKSKAIQGDDSSYWILQDYAPSPDHDHNHYFTPDQLRQTADSIENSIINSNYKGRYYIFASGESSLRLDIADNAIVLLRSGATAGEVSDKWDSRMGTPDPNIQYSNIYVVFDTDLQGSILTFKSYTTQNVGKGSSELSIRNNAIIESLDFHDNTYHDMTYKSVVSKYDGGKNSDGVAYKESTGSGTTMHNQKELPLGENGERVLKWVIGVNLPEDMEYDSDVIITERLPDGIKILPGSAHPGDEQIVFYIDTNYKLNQKELWDFNFSDYMSDMSKSTKIETNLGICTLSKNEENTNVSVRAKKLENNTYEIRISPELAQHMVGGNYSAKIKINACIEDDFDWGSFEHDFTNNVTVTYQNHELGSVSQTQTIHRNVISKVHGDYNANSSTIPYTITINPDGADLAIGTDVLTLTDVLRYTMPTGRIVNATLMYDSIQVIDIRTQDDITSRCNFTASEERNGTGVSHTFVMTVPDNTPLEVRYTYKMSGEGRLTDLSNTALIEGSGGSTDESNVSYDVAVQQSGAGAVVVGINVYKVDSQNYGVHLNGAKFKLEKWNGTAWEEVKTYVTDTNGTFNTGELLKNVAYQLTETQAPAGYEMITATTYEFYVIGSGPLIMPDGFTGKALNDGDSITIENDAAPFELPETGGMGTPLYYAAGGMLMMAAAILLICRKRRNTAY